MREALTYPNTQWAIIASTYRNLNDFIIPMLAEELWVRMGNPDGFSEVIDSFNKQSLTIRLINGSTIYLRSCDRPDDLRGPNLSGFFIDEAAKVPHRVWKIMAARCRVAPEKGWITTTPRGRNWVWEEFARKKRKNYEYFIGSTLENKFISKEYKQSLIESYSGSFLSQEVYGEFVGWEGLVYNIDIDKHHRDAEDTDYRYYIAGLDWGWVDPSVILIGGVGFDNEVHVVDEWYQNKTPIEHIVERAQEFAEQYNMRTWYCDSARPEYISALRVAGFDARKGKKELDPGIAVVNRYMDNDLLHIDFNRCPNLVDEMQTYHYEEDDLGTILKDKPIDKDNHACDALRYMVYSHSKIGYIGSHRGFR